MKCFLLITILMNLIFHNETKNIALGLKRSDKNTMCFACIAEGNSIVHIWIKQAVNMFEPISFFYTC